jgi:hypothetical protein
MVSTYSSTSSEPPTLSIPKELFVPVSPSQRSSSQNTEAENRKQRADRIEFMCKDFEDDKRE